MNLSNYGENLLLNYILNTQTTVRPTSWYVGFFSDSSGLTTDEPHIELSGNGYSRHGVSFGPSVNGTVSNLNPITFSATGNWDIITYTGIFDSPNNGNLLFWAPVESPISLKNGGQIIFAIHTITATID